MTRSLCVLALTAAVGCAAAPPAATPSSEGASKPPAPVAITARPDDGSGVLKLIEDDYAGALAAARQRGVPLFIDTWATWCHTCLSMRSYVFPDPAMRKVASKFVWLSLDTEREENAPIVARLGMKVLPTLYVVDPATEKPVLAWPGSLTAPELVALLDDTATSFARHDLGSAAAAALLKGNQATAAKDADGAVEAYRAALSAAPPAWPRRPQAVDGLVTALAVSGKNGPCVTTAADEARSLPPGTALADVLRAGIGCADDLPRAAPERTRLAELAALGQRTADDLSQPILADDRSDLYDYVLQALRATGRDAGDVARVARSWSAFLDHEAAAAATPEARVVFDSHRLKAYLMLGEPDRAIAMLQQSQTDFPKDYNPPARLGVAYLAQKHYDAALASLERALTLAYGPRKLRIWSDEADVYEAMGDAPGERRALAAALAFSDTLPSGTGHSRMRDSLAARLAKIR